MKSVIKVVALITLIYLLPLSRSHSFSNQQNASCKITKEETSYLLKQTKLDKKPYIRSLPECKRSNHLLMAQIININPEYLEFASDSLKDDEFFIGKMFSTSPKILKYSSNRLKSDQFFMSRMAIINPKALRYASEQIKDSKSFMKKMIKSNPDNFLYASRRIQNDKKISLMAIEGNGMMLKFSSSKLQNNKKFVTVAIKSNVMAISFASDKLKKDPEIQALTKQINYYFLNNFERFLRDNYSGLPIGPEGYRGYKIVNMAKLHKKSQLINRPYPTKWQQIYRNGVETNEVKFENNLPEKRGWKSDFIDYPELTKDIEAIFSSNNVDQNTINSLQTTSLWKFPDDPEALVFNLYLSRKVSNSYFDGKIFNITSKIRYNDKEAEDISEEAEKEDEKEKIGKEEEDKEIKKKNQIPRKWLISIADSNFDINLKMDIASKKGHKRYEIWDLYVKNKEDKNPKIIFRIEDTDYEYFETYAKQINNRYIPIFQGGGNVMETNLFEDFKIV
jgi:hypothetical protein